MLEIGIDREESMKLWSEFLPKAEIHGIDILPFESSERITMHQIDQSNPTQLAVFSTKYDNTFSFIIDDGSHVPQHQILTLNKIWKCLKPGGIYIIEDIETNYWGKSEIYGYPFNSRKQNLMEFLNESVDYINSEFVSHTLPKNHVFEEFESISFGQNCVVIEKKHHKYDTFYNRKYRYSHLQNNRGIKAKLKRSLSLLKKGRPADAIIAFRNPHPTTKPIA